MHVAAGILDPEYLKDLHQEEAAEQKSNLATQNGDAGESKPKVGESKPKVGGESKPKVDSIPDSKDRHLEDIPQEISPINSPSCEDSEDVFEDISKTIMPAAKMSPEDEALNKKFQSELTIRKRKMSVYDGPESTTGYDQTLLDAITLETIKATPEDDDSPRQQVKINVNIYICSRYFKNNSRKHFFE